MADDDGAPVAELLHHLGDIACEIMQCDVRHGACATADTAWLRPQDAKPSSRESFRHLIVVVGIPRKRRQQNDGRALAFRDYFDLHVTITNKFGAALSGRRAAWQTCDQSNDKK